MNNCIPASAYCKKIFDGTHDTPKPVLSGFPLITSKNILGGILNLKDSYNISEVNYTDIQKRSKVSQWDILFSMIGSVGEIYLEKSPNIPYAIKNVGVFSCNDEYKAKWLYYYFKSPLAKQYIQNYLNGAVQKFLPLGTLRSFPVLPYDDKYISSIDLLFALDSKIELNNCINAELEAMAKTLYDYWFVQFDFPDKNGKPYKTSGGKMVWNEELKREIPEGWESLKLSSKFTFEKGIEPGSAEYTEQKESIYHVNFIRVGDVDGSSAIFIDTRPKSYAMVFERDVLVTFDGSVGKVAFGLQGAYSGGLRKIYDKSGLIDNSLIYFIFMDERLIKTIHKYATGSILLHAGSSIDILKIPYNEKIYLEYQNIIKTSYNKMVINKKENQKLTKLRDWLLPMLMNGQVKVA